MIDQPDKALIVCRSEETVTLRHLIFEIVNCNDIMVVLAGIAAMHDVFIQSVNKRKIISVYSGAKLTADCCEFQGTTIVCFPGATVCLTRCVFQDDMLAVKVSRRNINIYYISEFKIIRMSWTLRACIIYYLLSIGVLCLWFNYCDEFYSIYFFYRVV